MLCHVMKAVAYKRCPRIPRHARKVTLQKPEQSLGMNFSARESRLGIHVRGGMVRVLEHCIPKCVGKEALFHRDSWGMDGNSL